MNATSQRLKKKKVKKRVDKQKRGWIGLKICTRRLKDMESTEYMSLSWACDSAQFVVCTEVKNSEPGVASRVDPIHWHCEALVMSTFALRSPCDEVLTVSCLLHQNVSSVFPRRRLRPGKIVCT